MKRIDTAIKQTLHEEHCVGTGSSPKDFVLFRKSCETNRYFLYWADGEIERRDLYVVENGEATLEAMYQRENNKWIHLQ